jgi:hypothetical protein
MDFVDQTVRSWASTAFTWGKSDCAMSVLAYVEAATGRSIRVRPDHSDPKSATRLLFQNGGFPSFAGAILNELGLIKTDSPDRGDVGLVDFERQGLTMCICLGNGRWAAKCNFAVVLKPASFAHAWALPHA